ncbi:L,D-transpeptidase family protein [Sphingomonas profundi]|uniref:L,D-transpeptidase family protein n=1 Tax=Alterirhizorhabdus profundi TaxID=2681549 RepID=UPI0012E80E25|nr:L,D-transpeptidase family protein [Sphingomonas profundi]
MDGRFGKAGAVGGKLLFAGALGLLAFQMSGRTATEPAAAPSPPAAKAPAPIAQAAPPPAAAPVALPAAAGDDAFVVRRVLDLKAPLHHGEYAWDDAGVPQGPIVITIDLAAEMLSIFRDGYEIGAAPILYGADSKPTPLGTFPILQKDAHHVSNLYGAPMPYAMRLTNDGVFVHASEVSWDAATHGCIGVPKPFAQKLFAQARIGDKVIITKGRMMDVSGLRGPA